jgi:hypothetical protein
MKMVCFETRSEVGCKECAREIDLIKLSLLPLSADRRCVRVAMQRESEGKRLILLPTKAKGDCAVLAVLAGNYFRMPKQAGQLNSVIRLQL